jgi:hypothetical protein
MRRLSLQPDRVAAGVSINIEPRYRSRHGPGRSLEELRSSAASSPKKALHIARTS